jgi:hypothetical protein
MDHERLPLWLAKKLINPCESQSNLRPAVYHQSIGLGDKPLETHDQYFFQLNTWGYNPYVTSSLTRGWMCRLQLLLTLASAVILRSESDGAHDHILLFQIRVSPNLDGQVPVFISPQQEGGPVAPPGIAFPFRRLLRLAGLRWRYSTPLGLVWTLFMTSREPDKLTAFKDSTTVLHICVVSETLPIPW